VDGELTCPDGELTCVGSGLTCVDGELTCPDGELTCVDGELTCPDCELTCPDGELTCPDGELTYVDGELTCVDGELTCVDGELARVDGELTRVDGESMAQYAKTPHPLLRHPPRHWLVLQPLPPICGQRSVRKHEAFPQLQGETLSPVALSNVSFEITSANKVRFSQEGKLLTWAASLAVVHAM
jgi:hypothetical protein